MSWVSSPCQDSHKLLRMGTVAEKKGILKGWVIGAEKKRSTQEPACDWSDQVGWGEDLSWGETVWFFTLCAGYSVCPSRSPFCVPGSFLYRLHHPDPPFLWFLGGLSQCEASAGDKSKTRDQELSPQFPSCQEYLAVCGFYTKVHSSWKATPPVSWQVNLYPLVRAELDNAANC